MKTTQQIQTTENFSIASNSLNTIDRLIGGLNSSNISYCHWKSNYTLAQAIVGELDLDLLIDRRALSLVQDILTKLGFKPAVVRWGQDSPGISHHYGIDNQTGELVHVHLFSHVLTGESFVKSHALPFDSMLLENGSYINQIKVPSKQAELVLFVLRTFIKYGSLLDLIYLSRDSQQISAELSWLLNGYDLSESLNLLRKHCPEVDEDLFIQCIDSLNRQSSLASRVLLARNVRKRLRVYAVNSSLSRILAYIQLLWGYVLRLLDGKRKNKKLESGGIVIAFVGPEATGKSTLVSNCVNWLGQDFAVRSVHAGKPPSSWLTVPVNLILPLMRRLLPRLRTTRLEGHTSSINRTNSQARGLGFPTLIYGIRAVTLAWDRQQLLLKARRFADKGEIVISDRYPSETIGAMDSPRLQEDRNKSGMISDVVKWLSRFEQRIYDRIPAPDIVIRLKVSIETAKERNRERIKPGKETDTYVESRHQQNQDWNLFGTTYIHDINTEQLLAKTILNVKNVIWESL